MLQIWDAFKLKGRGTALYCKDDNFNNMSKSEVKDYISKIKNIKVYDKNSNEITFAVKEYDVSSSISDKIAVAFLIDKTIENDDITIPSDVTVVSYLAD
jgi:hypothetical protein